MEGVEQAMAVSTNDAASFSTGKQQQPSQHRQENWCACTSAQRGAVWDISAQRARQTQWGTTHTTERGMDGHPTLAKDEQ